MSDKKAAIYARSATGEGDALEQQIERCCAFARENGYTVDERLIYKEVGRGSIDPHEHKQFSRLFAAIQRHEFGTLVVTRPDRLSRNDAIVRQVIEELKQSGVEVVLADWSRETTAPYGYRRNEQGTGYTINPEEADVIRRLYGQITDVQEN